MADAALCPWVRHLKTRAGSANRIKPVSLTFEIVIRGLRRLEVAQWARRSFRDSPKAGARFQPGWQPLRFGVSG